MFALGLTDLDLLDLGEILIAEDENNVAGFPTPFIKSLQFFVMIPLGLYTLDLGCQINFGDSNDCSANPLFQGTYWNQLFQGAYQEHQDRKVENNFSKSVGTDL